MMTSPELNQALIGAFMSDIQEPIKKKQGRPQGYSPVKAEPKQVMVISEDDDYLVIKVQKKAALKVLLKELI